MSNLAHIVYSLSMGEKFRLYANAMNATKLDLEPLRLGCTSRCATRGKSLFYASKYSCPAGRIGLPGSEVIRQAVMG